ncbi:FG-GAP repeat domain-containing protein [Limibacillus halophilus]|jgi:hypothetical protein
MRRGGLLTLGSLLALLLAAPGAGAQGLPGYKVEYFPGDLPLPSPSISLPQEDWPEDTLPDGHVARGEKGIARAWLVDPTTRYQHGALGDRIEAGGLEIETGEGERLRFELPNDSVFEDTMPRLADLDGDGLDEVLVMRSYRNLGAALSVIANRQGVLGPIAETPAMGAANRWANPVGEGTGDFDGDGLPEVALIETPHIGGTLYIFRLVQGRFQEVAGLRGLSNHRFGSRWQKLSLIYDLDGDGDDDILAPNQERDTLVWLSLEDDKLVVKGSLPLPAKIETDIEVGRGPAFRFLLSDGSLAEITPSW